MTYVCHKVVLNIIKFIYLLWIKSSANTRKYHLGRCTPRKISMWNLKFLRIIPRSHKQSFQWLSNCSEKGPWTSGRKFRSLNAISFRRLLDQDGRPFRLIFQDGNIYRLFLFKGGKDRLPPQGFLGGNFYFTISS